MRKAKRVIALLLTVLMLLPMDSLSVLAQPVQSGEEILMDESVPADEVIDISNEDMQEAGKVAEEEALPETAQMDVSTEEGDDAIEESAEETAVSLELKQEEYTENTKANSCIAGLIAQGESLVGVKPYLMDEGEHVLLVTTSKDESNNLYIHVFPLDETGNILGNDAANLIDSALYEYSSWDKTVVFEGGIEKINLGGLGYAEKVFGISLPDSLKEIGDGSFAHVGCEQITLPNSLEKIGKQAFTDAAIREITIPGSVLTIGEKAFSYCRSLSKVVIGDDSTGKGPATISEMAFFFCTNLNEVVIGDCVETIEQYAFLKSFREYNISINANAKNSLTIGSGIKTIGKGAFEESYIRELHLPALEVWCAVDFASAASTPTAAVDPATNVNGPFDVTSPMKGKYDLYIGDSTEPIKSLVIPDGVKEIKPYAFFGLNKMEEIVIPASVEKIGLAAFNSGRMADRAYIFNSQCQISSETSIPYTFVYCEHDTVDYYDWTITSVYPICASVIYGYENSTAQAYAKKCESSLNTEFSLIKEGARDYTKLTTDETLAPITVEEKEPGKLTLRWKASAMAEPEDAGDNLYYNFLFGDYYESLYAGKDKPELKATSIHLDGKDIIDLPVSYFSDGKHTDAEGYYNITIDCGSYEYGFAWSSCWQVEKVSKQTIAGLPGYLVHSRTEISKEFRDNSGRVVYQGNKKDVYASYGMQVRKIIDEGESRIAVDEDGNLIDLDKMPLGSTKVEATHSRYLPYIEFHVGEDKWIEFTLLEKGLDDNPVHLEDLKKTYPDLTISYALKRSERLGGSSPYSKTVADDSHLTLVKKEGDGMWLRGASETSDAPSFLDVTISAADLGTFLYRVVYKVLPAESGKEYFNLEHPKGAMTVARNEAEGLQQIREAMKKREDFATIYIVGDLMVSEEKLFDFNEERPGMAPNEGDYLHFHTGSRTESYFEGDVMNTSWENVGDTSITKIEVFYPFITNAEEEAKVDAKIQGLLGAGGALHEAATNGTKEQKAKAAFDWVVKNVSSTPSNRTHPRYHTAYSAFIDHNGTCEAYALAFYRLCREMGVANRIIMGTDSAAHAYNIVELDDGYWYYADTSNGRWKQTYTQFSRAVEQSQYRSINFILNYISKIKGYVSQGGARITDQDGGVFDAGSLIEARQYVIKQVKGSEQKEKLHYTISLLKDTTAEALDELDFAEYSDSFGSDCFQSDHFTNCMIRGCDYSKYVTLDLNGYTYKSKSRTYVCMRVSEVKNGEIDLGQNGALHLLGQNWSSTKNKVTGVKIKGLTNNEYCAIHSGVLVDKNTTISGCPYVDVQLGSTVECDITTQEMILGAEGDGEIFLNGNVSTKYLWSELPATYYSDARLDELLYGTKDSYRYKIHVNNLTVTAGTKLHRGSYLQVHGKASLAGKIYIFDSATTFDGYFYDFKNSVAPSDEFVWNYFPAAIEIARDYDAAGNLVRQGQITLNGILDEYEIGTGEYTRDVYLDPDNPSVSTRVIGLPGLDIYPIKVSADGKEEKTVFTRGDEIGDISLSGILYRDGKTAKAMNLTNMGDYIKIAANGVLEQNGTKINVGGPSAKLTLNVNDAEAVVEYTEKRIYADTTYGILPIPASPGKIFLGWFTEPEGGRQITSAEPVPAESQLKDVTLYAHWDLKYAVEKPTFYYQDGSKKVLISDGDAVIIPAGKELYVYTDTNGATIYYSTSELVAGDDFAKKGKPYAGSLPLTVGAETSIWVAAVKDGCKNSEVAHIKATLENEKIQAGDVSEADLLAGGYASVEQITEALWTVGITDCDYTGKAITFPDLKVYFGKKLLESGKDYTLSYKNNVKAGTAQVKVTGKGFYQGNVTETFQIRGLDMAGAEIADPVVYVNCAADLQKVSTQVWYTIGENRILLKAGKDYQLEYDVVAIGGINASFTGEKDLTVKIKGIGNFDKYNSFIERVTSKIPMNTLTYTIQGGVYDGGKPVEPAAITVKQKDALKGVMIADASALESAAAKDADADYFYYCTDNTMAGVAKITFVANPKGAYAGSVTKQYNVVGEQLKKAGIKNLASAYELGSQDKIEPFGTKDGAYLEGKNGILRGVADEAYASLSESDKLAVDYTYRYLNQDKAGVATVILTGKNGWSGEVKKTYKIKGLDVKNAAVTGVQDSYVYNGDFLMPAGPVDGATPSGFAVTLTDQNGKQIKLTKSTDGGKTGDYTVSYQKNGAKGKGLLLVKGINRYEGTLKCNFKIEACDVTDATRIKVANIGTVKYVKGGATPIPEVTDLATGKTLVINKDFTVKYANNGAANVGNPGAKQPTYTIAGKGNYSGKLATMNFDIEIQDISAVSIAAADVEAQAKPGLGKISIVLTDSGNKKLAAGTDYEKNIKFYYTEDTLVKQIKNGKETALVRSEKEEVDTADIIPAGTTVGVVVQGKNNYKKTIETTFRYVKTDLSKATILLDKQYYTGKPICPLKTQLTVSTKATGTVSGSGYEIVYYGENITGKGTVTIKGVGEYGGTKTLTFPILKRIITR